MTRASSRRLDEVLAPSPSCGDGSRSNAGRGGRPSGSARAAAARRPSRRRPSAAVRGWPARRPLAHGAQRGIDARLQARAASPLQSLPTSLPASVAQLAPCPAAVARAAPMAARPRASSASDRARLDRAAADRFLGRHFDRPTRRTLAPAGAIRRSSACALRLRSAARAVGHAPDGRLDQVFVDRRHAAWLPSALGPAVHGGTSAGSRSFVASRRLAGLARRGSARARPARRLPPRAAFASATRRIVASIRSSSRFLAHARTPMAARRPPPSTSSRQIA